MFWSNCDETMRNQGFWVFLKPFTKPLQKAFQALSKLIMFSISRQKGIIPRRFDDDHYKGILKCNLIKTRGKKPPCGTHEKPLFYAVVKKIKPDV